MRKIKVLSLPETIKEKSTFRNVDFSFIVSGSDITFTFRVLLNTLPTLATLVRDINKYILAITFFLQKGHYHFKIKQDHL